MQNHGYYIYLFREKKTNKTIYVGRTLHPMRRLSEHREAIKTGSAPLYVYMRDNDLELYKDVDVVITEFIDDGDTVANEREQYYTTLYSDTVLNVHLGDVRAGKYSDKNRPVKCLTDGKTYNSVKDVFNSYEGVTNLYSHLKYGTRLKNGLVFKYIDGADNSDNVWKIQCLDDEQKFSSIKNCAEHYGISASILYHKGLDGRPFTVGMAGKGNKHCSKLRFVKFI